MIYKNDIYTDGFEKTVLVYNCGESKSFTYSNNNIEHAVLKKVEQSQINYGPL